MRKKSFILKTLIVAGSIPFGLAAQLMAADAPAQPTSTDKHHVVSQETSVLEDTIISKNPNREVIRYPYIGIALETLPAATSLENSAPGVQVIYVLRKSPAWESDVRIGDILLTLDGQKLFFPNQFSALLRSYKPGDEIEIMLLRNGEKLKKIVTVGERCVRSVPRTAERNLQKPPCDDIRLYINGRELVLDDDAQKGGWISVTPNGILIRDTIDVPAEFRRLVQRVHSKLPDSQKMLSALKKRYNEARAAALGKARQTFSQVFFGHGNSVIIVGNEKERQVTVSRADDDEILFRGPCATQADIDAIPKEAKEIIDSFTILKPMLPDPAEKEEPTPVPAEVPSSTREKEAPPAE